MAILLDHVIVPSRSPVGSALVLAEILGVAWEAKVGHFTPVYVNETLTLDGAIPSRSAVAGLPWDPPSSISNPTGSRVISTRSL